MAKNNTTSNASLLNEDSDTSHIPNSASTQSYRMELPYYSRLVNWKKNIAIEINRFKEGSLPNHLKCIPLSSDAEFALFCLNCDDSTFVPRIYAAFVHFTGKSDESYDSWKGSFSFKFLLDVDKAGHSSQYLYWIMHYRQFMRIEVYQCVPKTDLRPSDVSSEPEEILFSKKDITEFTISFFKSLLDNVDKAKYVPNPFVIKADSELCFSGFLNGKYFSNKHSKQESYKKDYDKTVEIIKNLDTFAHEDRSKA